MRGKTKSKDPNSEGMKRLGLYGQIVCFDGKARLFFEIHRLGNRRRLGIPARRRGAGRNSLSTLQALPHGSLIETAARRDCDSVKQLDRAGDSPLASLRFVCQGSKRI